MFLSDTHCHLNHRDFETDWSEALERALQAQVQRLLVIGFDLASSRRAVWIAKQCPRNVQAVIGIHPESAQEWTPEAAQELAAMALDLGNKVVGWGEIGLDYHWESVPHARQRDVFVAQIAAAKHLGLPIVIHCREAYEDVLSALAEREVPNAVLHCFTGTPEQAQVALSAGFYLGIGGVVTFKNAPALRDIVRDAPLERLLIETDSPYLAPQPWRGKRNEPAYVAAVAETIAMVKGISVEEVARQTTANAARLFGEP